MILNFEHRNAAHCETGVTSSLLKFYDYQLSEPMTFGIGAGLFFIYIPFVSLKGDMPKFSFRTMPGTIFSRVMKNLHINVGIKHFSNKEKAMEEMDELLAAGIPVGNVVGLYYLPYSPVRQHFNFHNLCVIGKEGDEYIVSDPLHPVLNRLSSHDLKKVRFAEGLSKPRGKMYWIKEKPALLDLSQAIVDGIKKTCKNMLDIPLPIFGVSGISMLSKRVRNLGKKYGEKDAALYLLKLVQLLEEFGTGGAGFRFMYSAFLQEASQILNKPKLQDFAIEMSKIGNLWRQFALESGRKVKSRTNMSYDELADKLLEIAAAEKIFFVTLKKYIETECRK